MNCEINGMFDPESLVVIGASSKRDYYFLRCHENFKGKLYAVNRNEEAGREVIPGVKFYRSVLDIPEKIDFAIIEVPGEEIPAIIRKCGKRGVKFATVFASGYSELGTEAGKHAEEELIEAANAAGIKIIGPNCMGIYYPAKGMSFRFDLSTESGEVSFVSQSGGHALNFSLLGSIHGIKFDKVISYGNGAMIDSTDLIEYLMHDPSTGIIAAYIEGVKDGRRFLSVLKEAAQIKPVIIWKGGVTDAGASAVTSHSGSLAGDARIWDAALKQAGVIRVDDMDELIDVTSTLTTSPLPENRRVGIISISGGQCVVLADLASRYGFRIPPLGDVTREKLSKLMPNVGTSIKNPIDGAASWANLGTVKETIRLVMEDEGIDSVLIEISIHYMLHIFYHNEEDRMSRLYEILCELKNQSRKPFFVILSPSNYWHERRLLEEKLIESGVPVFPGFKRALKTLKNLLHYKERGGRSLYE